MDLVSYERSKTNPRDDWETPPELFKVLHQVFCFQLDVCAGRFNAKLPAYFGEGGVVADGLAVDWHKYASVCWCNPPFSNWSAWLEQALGESVKGVTTVFLVPPRTDSHGFHDQVPGVDEVIFLRGRASFLLNGVVHERNGTASALYVIRPRLPRAQYGNPRIVFWEWKEVCGL